MFYFWSSLKYFPCCYTFYHLHYLLGTHHWYRLHKKMHMIFLSPNLQKMYFISLFYFDTYLLNSFIYLFCDYYFPVFCRTYYMIYQH